MPFGSRNGGVVDRIWLEHYPRGVPAEIDVNEYASAREVFEESCRKFATRPAFSCMGRSISFADLDALSSTFGAWLQGVGCAKGTRVALMMPNILQYPVCLFGALRAGCTVVNVNPLYTARELEHQLDDSGAEVIVVVENFAQYAAGSRRAYEDPADGRDVDRRDAGRQGTHRRPRAAPGERRRCRSIRCPARYASPMR
jgi:acyl-CoA synthetase (AMP-forming)/AMP-acid ligase II